MHGDRRGGQRTRTVILGAAGRDFHNFNVAFRADPSTRVVAFTATQIPGVEGRSYPACLAGADYPDGIPIVAEAELEAVCRRERVQQVVFAYSDVSHSAVMHLGSRALALGADFVLLGPERTMIDAGVPVIAVSAVRTGCGKSQTARQLGRILRRRGCRVAVLRHPMPYGDLSRQRVQRFACARDLDDADCTAEEREEYEPHIAAGNLVFAGIDYLAIARSAEVEADVIVWDGGNNDFPFLRPALHIVLVDALRPGQTTAYHPGEAVLRMADIVVVNKVDAAGNDAVAAIETEVRATNRQAPIVRAASPIRLDDPSAVAGRRVIVVEDGPTITHGGMPHGAGYVAALQYGARTVVDPRPFATGPVRDLFAAYPHIGPVLPAVGYRADQLEALRKTIESSDADVVVAATPMDLARRIDLGKPVVRAHYEYADAGEPTLANLVEGFLARLGR